MWGLGPSYQTRIRVRLKAGEVRPQERGCLAQGNSATRHLGFGMLALCFPMRKVEKTVRQCGKASRLIRDLPAEVVVFYVIPLMTNPWGAAIGKGSI